MYRVIAVSKPNRVGGLYRDVFVCNGACCSRCQLKYRCFTLDCKTTMILDKAELTGLSDKFYSTETLLKLATLSGIYKQGTKKFKSFMSVLET